MTTMPRTLRVVLLGALVAAGVVAPDQPARADEAPPRHVSARLHDRIGSQAAVALTTHPGCAFLTQRRLTATALAIVFKESGTGLSKAPSPMTLSRYDVYRADGSSIQQANYGLYAFRDPDTAYLRAFWHPGVGQWQLDDSGLGIWDTAAERISTATSTDLVVDELADRWCSPTSPPNESTGRYRAWGPWGCGQSISSSSCVYLSSLYTELYTDGGMDRLVLDPIADLGGAVARTCQMGDGSQLPCTYVDPALAQGDTWWRANLTGASPLAAPFYVTEVGGVERRAWLREDSGYSIDITAARTLGRNSRPVSSADGVRWSASSSLCDVTELRGRCEAVIAELVPPVPLNLRRLSTPPGRTPVVGDYTGDGREDILWYGPGAVGDELWVGTGDGQFQPQATSVHGAEYQPFSARLGGTGRDDILWYEPATGKVVRWVASPAGAFSSTVLQVPAGTTPLVGDFDGDGRHEIHWYGKRELADVYWDVPGSAVVATDRAVRGAYLPRVGDFDGNGVDDVFWYGPGSLPDSVWLYQPGGGRVQVGTSVQGTYKPTVGDFDGDGRDDIYWYAPGPAGDTIWFGVDGRTWVPRSRSITSVFRLFASDLDLDGHDELVLYQAGTGPDHLWRFGDDRQLADWESVSLDGSYSVQAGRFGAPGSAGALWVSDDGASGVWYP